MNFNSHRELICLLKIKFLILKMRIIAIMMVKNESTNIERSISSIQSLDGLVMYDTGSTDNTIELARSLCEKYNLQFHLLQGEFEDFSKSRNKLIDYAQSLKVSDWMVLLDANDELQNAEGLRKYLENVKDVRVPLEEYIDAICNECALESTIELKPRILQKLGETPFADVKEVIEKNPNIVDKYILNIVSSRPVAKPIVITRDCIYLLQKWKTAENNYIEFKNHRCIRSDTSMRFIGVVHECLVDALAHPSKVRMNEILEDVIVYQDRLLDTTQSSEKRWVRDKKLLQKEYFDKSKPADPRTIFYFAQTCKCLGEYSQARRLYEERYNFIGGFEEERYVSAYECGVLEYTNYTKQFKPPENLKSDSKKDMARLENAKIDYEKDRKNSFENAKMWFNRAFEHSPRAEPLLVLGRHYFDEKKYYIAYMYLNMAVRLPVPTTSLLWFNKEIYNYERWHLHSIISELNGFTDDAIISCQKAIDARGDENDKKNMALFVAEKMRKTNNLV
jgi:glycosyltransferase involved in cell wall biosynthesis